MDKGGLLGGRQHKSFGADRTSAAAVIDDVELGKKHQTYPHNRNAMVKGEEKHSHAGRVTLPSARALDLLYVQEKLKKVLETQPQLDDINEHMMSVHEVAERYKVTVLVSNPRESPGLTTDEAQRRLIETGRNEFSPPKVENAFIAFFKLLADPLSIMLLASAILSLASQAFAVSGDFTAIYLGCVLMFVVVANTTVDFVQQRKSANMLKGLLSLAPAKAMVRRDGVSVEVEASQLVLGDIVLLKLGDSLPADVRIIGCVEMAVDNSNLTGENEPQKRHIEADHPQVLEAENLAFMGTTILKGSGVGIVIRRGDLSVMGKISELAGATADDVQSPLAVEIGSFVIMIAMWSLVLSIVVFGVALGIGNTFITALSLFIGVFVACTPQGLPATATMLLAYAAKELSKHNVLVKNLHAVDTLGAITLLCSDKTGTLTMNKMTVVSLWENFKEVIEDNTLPLDRDLLLCMLLCNSAAFVTTAENLALPVETREVLGDATETALLRFVSAKMDSNEIREANSTSKEIPFDSDKKWAARIVKRSHANGHFTCYLKGAPERVLKLCSMYMDNGVQKSADEDFKTAFDVAYTDMASKGRRVIACAVWYLDGTAYPASYDFEEFEESELQGGVYVFSGMIGLLDPPKPGVLEAVQECHTGGIQVMMITGDHPITAGAIAREVGIIQGRTKEEAALALGIEVSQVPVDDYEAVVLHGDELSKMTDAQWEEALSKREVVFARTSPQQKLEIVTRAQTMGHIVAMTGDGVNDSPALKRANMGIAMAITGSDVSREAASLILLDDNFASIVEGIKRGRTIFVNMKKSICLTLSHIIAELMPTLFMVIIGLPLGLSSFLILFVDLGTEIAPALSLASEPCAANIMTRPPRHGVRPRDVVILPKEVRDFETNTTIRIETDTDVPDDADAITELSNRLKRRVKFTTKMKAGIKNIKAAFLGGKRHDEDEHLVDWELLRFAYIQTGTVETLWAMVVYFMVFRYYEVTPASELVGMNPGLFPSIDDKIYTNPDEVTFSPGRQKDILATVQSSYYFSVVIMQFFTCYILKATDNPLWSKTAWVNMSTYWAIAFSVCLAFCVNYLPGVQDVLGSSSVPGFVFGLAIAGGFIHVTIEGVRRLIVRYFWSSQ